VPYYKDRTHAGKVLADALQQSDRPKPSLIIALPRGGLVVAKPIADQLNIPLDVICPKKIVTSEAPEYARGAITEDGTLLIDSSLEPLLKREIQEAYLEAKRRAERYRKERAPVDLNQKNILLVDDGIATGLTLEAAIASLKKRGCGLITLCVPVAPPHALARLKSQVDGVICPIQDPALIAVGAYYDDFRAITDAEVEEILRQKKEG
jgi:putative phosphoribosyl transferase